MPHLDFDFSWWTALPAAACFFLLIRFAPIHSVSLPPAIRRGLLSLQCLALALLALQLFSPALVIRNNVFLDPVILIVRDMSSSFMNGRALGLETRYEGLSRRIHNQYGNRGFQIREYDFSQAIRPSGTAPRNAVSSGEGYFSSLDTAVLTDMSLLSSLIADSLGKDNLQGAFLFSDGRHNAGKNTTESLFPCPVFPMVFLPIPLNDIQLDSVILPGKTSPHSSGREGRERLSVRWTRFGEGSSGFSVSLSSPRKVIKQKEVRPGAAMPDRPDRGEEYFSSDGISFGCGSPSAVSLAVVQGGDSGGNPFNDTLSVPCTSGEGLPQIIFLKSVSTPDENWMIRTLINTSEYEVSSQSLEKELEKNSRGTQLWMPADGTRQVLPALLEDTRVIIYGERRRPGPALKGLRPESPSIFSLNSLISIHPDCSPYFQKLHLKLSDLSDRPLYLPRPDSTARCLLTVEDGGGKGCLLSAGETGLMRWYRFAYSGFWKKLFDPDVPYTVKEQIRSLITGTAELARAETGETMAQIPSSFYEGVPFSMSFKVKKDTGTGQGLVTFACDSDSLAFSTSDISSLPAHSVLKTDSIILPPGGCRAVFAVSGNTRWSDSITVRPKKSLELARIGFDLPFLQQLARSSGGSMITENSVSDTLPPALPVFSGGQIKKIREAHYPLYNTRAGFILVFLLMSGYWFARKKLSLD